MFDAGRQRVKIWELTNHAKHDVATEKEWIKALEDYTRIPANSSDDTPASFLVVPLNQARDFNNQMKSIYVFKKLEWESLSVDLLPHPDMFTDEQFLKMGRSDSRDKDGAKRLFVGGERFLDSISGSANVSLFFFPSVIEDVDLVVFIVERIGFYVLCISVFDTFAWYSGVSYFRFLFM